jgi:gamma-glutamyl-gamma-aminobutyraldehyde dehydrogenase
MTAYAQIAAEIKTPSGIYIDGAFHSAQSGETFDTCNPFDGTVIASVPACGAADVDRAQSPRPARHSRAASGPTCTP